MSVFTHRLYEIYNRADGISIKETLSEEFLREQLAGTEADSVKSRIIVHGHLSKLEPRQVIFYGKIAGQLVLSCQRCLEPAIVNVEETINVCYAPADVIAKLHSDQEEDLSVADYIPYVKDTIDVTPAIREALLVAFPITVLCQENCLGFCQTCGINRNLKNCLCPKASEDVKRPLRLVDNTG